MWMILLLHPSWRTSLVPVSLLLALALGACRPAPEVDLQGHRGARGLLPENSLDGFLLALDLGVQTLEMDVVISRDAQVVVSHDPVMSSVICSHPDGRPVAETDTVLLYALDYADISTYDCGRRGHPDFPEQEPRPALKPLLGEVIHEAEVHAEEGGRAAPRYNVETKSRPDGDNIAHPPPGEFAALVIDVLRHAGVEERSTIQSFDPRTLVAARRLGWQGTLALLVARDEPPFEAILDSMGFTPEVLSPYHELITERYLERARELDMKIVPWTVNETQDMQRLIALRVDGIITDYPNRFPR